MSGQQDSVTRDASFDSQEKRLLEEASNEEGRSFRTRMYKSRTPHELTAQSYKHCKRCKGKCSGHEEDGSPPATDTTKVPSSSLPAEGGGTCEVLRKGQTCYYKDAVGGMYEVKVVNVDHSLVPPSYLVRFQDGRERETERFKLLAKDEAGRASEGRREEEMARREESRQRREEVQERREQHKAAGTYKQQDKDNLESIVNGLTAFPMGLISELKHQVDKM
mmetsp:Transcript_25293/g.83615  ORF Transcript_25293/g.83615 Transcript_25293/m.83615 type:complete len:221 (-) Transcript_25293:37-699(-)